MLVIGGAGAGAGAGGASGEKTLTQNQRDKVLDAPNMPEGLQKLWLNKRRFYTAANNKGIVGQAAEILLKLNPHV